MRSVASAGAELSYDSDNDAWTSGREVYLWIACCADGYLTDTCCCSPKAYLTAKAVAGQATGTKSSGQIQKAIPFVKIAEHTR